MSVRTIRDALLKVTKACPAANANHNSDAIDTGCTNPGAALESFELEIAIPALPSLAADKTLTVKVQDCATAAGSYTDVAELASFVVTGVSTDGSAAATRTVKLPSSIKRYIEVNLAVAASGGDNTAKSVVVSLIG